MKAYCSICRWPYVLKKDGTLRVHRQYLFAVGRGAIYHQCSGSGQKPAHMPKMKTPA